jgi:hypothetical protein
MAAVAADGKLGIDRESFEAAVSRYLDGEVRDSGIDQLLLIATADLEITAYLHDMVRKPILVVRL